MNDHENNDDCFIYTFAFSFSSVVASQKMPERQLNLTFRRIHFLSDFQARNFLRSVSHKLQMR